jgi:membrane-associated phospholipid phosphatase
LCALVLAPAPAYTQERAFPYSLGNPDRALVPAALISSALGVYLTGRTDPITLSEIDALDAQSINGVDRGAASNWSTTWQHTSDWSRNITVGASGLFAAAPYLLDGRWSESVTLGTIFAETMTLVVGVTAITKGLATRTRPYAYNTALTPEERLAVGGPNGHSVNLSFISGHTSMAFAAATLMSTVYADMHGHTTASKIVWGTSMSAAALAAYARVEGGMHFSTDVVVGAAVGVAVGHLVPALHRVGADHSLSASPSPGGVQLRWAVGGWNPPHA